MKKDTLQVKRLGGEDKERLYPQDLNGMLH